ncbi:hypothetical protein M413DRAFT_443032 [Hebeloma cylindrosporum]|uniref:Uncharacterized protein n=1 Tax=Hebeloma cylindrosporum TaxID=76867 RepID=A0A0C2YSE3_HEBCY|nr:hypothetical protein M413DRAFT_443032 [Hebeloma cylindrosporum h7]
MNQNLTLYSSVLLIYSSQSLSRFQYLRTLDLTLEHLKLTLSTTPRASTFADERFGTLLTIV